LLYNKVVDFEFEIKFYVKKLLIRTHFDGQIGVAHVEVTSGTLCGLI